MHTICAMASADSSRAGVDGFTATTPEGPTVTEKGTAPGGTSVVNPRVCSVGVGPAASNASVSAWGSRRPVRVTARSRPSFTR